MYISFHKSVDIPTYYMHIYSYNLWISLFAPERSLQIELTEWSEYSVIIWISPFYELEPLEININNICYLKPELMTMSGRFQLHYSNITINPHLCFFFCHFRLFETHPDVKDVFMPFNGMKVDELQHSKQLRAHALR